MVFPEVKVAPMPSGVNIPPPYSNQTPISPSSPWPISASIQRLQGIAQMIKTSTSHTWPAVDMYPASPTKAKAPRQQRPPFKRVYQIERINSPAGYEDEFAAKKPGGVRQQVRPPARRQYEALDFTVLPGQTNVRELQDYDPLTGIWQTIKMRIPSSPGPDSYAGRSGIAQREVPIRKKKMSYGADAGSFLGGVIVGFVAGAIVLTATGRKVTSEVASAASRRISQYVTPS